VDLAYHPSGRLYVLQLLPGLVHVVCQTCDPVPFGGLRTPSGMTFDGNGDLLVAVAAPEAPAGGLATDRVLRVPAGRIPAGGDAPTATPTGGPPEPTRTLTPTAGPTASATPLSRVRIYLPWSVKPS
jgi:hypothetical protein